MLTVPTEGDDARDPASPQPAGPGPEAPRGLYSRLSSPGEDSARGGPGRPQPVVRRGLAPRELLDPDAVGVVRRLQRFGHEAYLVGGCVRDLIAGHEPKDFDVATSARPNQIKRLFRNARIIGRRFRLAHILFDRGHIVEASTFRGEPDRDVPETDDPERADAPDAATGSRPSDRFADENVFGTADEDARRRDLTVNALFYDPVADTVIDWVGGLADLDAGVIRCIGNPDVRLVEDPVRMIRAVHFAERLGFRLEPALAASIAAHAADLERASGARLYVEILKLLGRGHARGTLRRLHELGVLRAWIPELAAHLDETNLGWPAEGGGTHEEASRGEPEGLPAAHATWNLLGAADRYGLAAHGAPESLALATLFGAWLLETLPLEAGRDFMQFTAHVEATFRPVALRMSIPRRAHFRMAEILYILLDLRHPPGPRRMRRLMQRSAFDEALVLFRLDLMARDADLAALDLWERRSGDEPAGSAPRGPEVFEEAGGRPRRRRRGRRERGPPPSTTDRIAPEAASWDDAPAPARTEAPAPRPSAPSHPPVAPPTPPPEAARPAAARPAAPPAQKEPERDAPERPKPTRAQPDDFSAGIV